MKEELDLDYVLDCNVSKSKPWGDEIVPMFIPGLPILDETLFLHSATKTLLVTDLVFNFQKEDISTIVWMYMKFVRGMQPMFVLPVFEERILDSQAFGDAINQVFSWDFEQVQMCHTQAYCEEDAKELFMESMSRLF